MENRRKFCNLWNINFKFTWFSGGMIMTIISLIRKSESKRKQIYFHKQLTLAHWLIYPACIRLLKSSLSLTKSQGPQWVLIGWKWVWSCVVPLSQHTDNWEGKYTTWTHWWQLRLLMKAVYSKYREYLWKDYSSLGEWDVMDVRDETLDMNKGTELTNGTRVQQMKWKKATGLYKYERRSRGSGQAHKIYIV